MGKRKRNFKPFEEYSMSRQKRQPLRSPSHRAHPVTALQPEPQPFSKDDALELYGQVKAFEQAYKDERYKTPDNADDKEVELAMIRGSLNLRIREISIALFHNFVAYPPANGFLSPNDPTTILLRDYQSSLTSANTAWEALLKDKSILRHLRRLPGKRRAQQTRHANRTQDVWWKSARAERREAAYEADADKVGTAGLCYDTPSSKEKRKQKKEWYKAAKKDMRKNGQLLTIDDPGYIDEFENVSDSGCFSDSVVRRAGVPRDMTSWLIPDHVQTKADLYVFMNQLGYMFTPVERPPRPAL